MAIKKGEILLLNAFDGNRCINYLITRALSDFDLGYLEQEFKGTKLYNEYKGTWDVTGVFINWLARDKEVIEEVRYKDVILGNVVDIDIWIEDGKTVEYWR